MNGYSVITGNEWSDEAREAAAAARHGGSGGAAVKFAVSPQGQVAPKEGELYPSSPLHQPLMHAAQWALHEHTRQGGDLPSEIHMHQGTQGPGSLQAHMKDAKGEHLGTYHGAGGAFHQEPGSTPRDRADAAKAAAARAPRAGGDKDFGQAAKGFRARAGRQGEGEFRANEAPTIVNQRRSFWQWLGDTLGITDNMAIGQMQHPITGQFLPVGAHGGAIAGHATGQPSKPSVLGDPEKDKDPHEPDDDDKDGKDKKKSTHNVYDVITGNSINLYSDDYDLGEDARRQCSQSHNPPSWAKDEALWRQAEQFAEKGNYGAGTSTHYAVVTHLYKELGGAVDQKSVTANFWSDAARAAAAASRNAASAGHKDANNKSDAANSASSRAVTLGKVGHIEAKEAHEDARDAHWNAANQTDDSAARVAHLKAAGAHGQAAKEHGYQASVTKNANPEGHNQYTMGGSSHKERLEKDRAAGKSVLRTDTGYKEHSKHGTTHYDHDGHITGFEPNKYAHERFKTVNQQYDVITGVN